MEAYLSPRAGRGCKVGSAPEAFGGVVRQAGEPESLRQGHGCVVARVIGHMPGPAQVEHFGCLDRPPLVCYISDGVGGIDLFGGQGAHFLSSAPVPEARRMRCIHDSNIYDVRRKSSIICRTRQGFSLIR